MGPSTAISKDLLVDVVGELDSLWWGLWCLDWLLKLLDFKALLTEVGFVTIRLCFGGAAFKLLFCDDIDPLLG